jgi:hypothetical protein
MDLAAVEVSLPAGLAVLPSPEGSDGPRPSRVAAGASGPGAALSLGTPPPKAGAFDP